MDLIFADVPEAKQELAKQKVLTKLSQFSNNSKQTPAKDSSKASEETPNNSSKGGKLTPKRRLHRPGDQSLPNIAFRHISYCNLVHRFSVKSRPKTRATDTSYLQQFLCAISRLTQAVRACVSLACSKYILF